MTSDSVNRWLTLGANIGVMVGLILLIFEINQNNELMQAQIEQSRSETFLEWRREIVSNEAIAQLWLTAYSPESLTQQSINELDPIEEVQLRNLVATDFYDFENLFSQYERGLVSEEYWQERIVPVIRNRAFAWKLLYPPAGPSGRRAFKDEVERILRNPEPR